MKHYVKFVFFITMLAGGVITAISVFSVVSKDVPRSSEVQAKFAAQIAEELSQALARRGAISDVSVEIEQCTLTLTTQYSRPCDEGIKGRFLMSSVLTADLNELSGSSDALHRSPSSFGQVDYYEWSFRPEIERPMQEIERKINADARGFMSAGINGAERAKLLSETALRMLRYAGISSRVSLSYCLQAPEITVPMFSKVTIEMPNDANLDALEKLLSYKREFCSQRGKILDRARWIEMVHVMYMSAEIHSPSERLA